MKKYLVKIVSKATEANTNFSGKTITFYYGKRQKLVGSFGDEYLGDGIWDGLAMEYGYNRECDAKRSYQYKNAVGKDSHWENEVSIVKYEI